MKIAVAGCGITGTAVASFLAQNGHQVTIFEQAPECRPVGAGIMLQPSGQETLKHLGLLDQVETCSSRLVGMTAKLTSGKNLIRLRYSKLGSKMYALGVHRGRLFNILLETCRQLGVQIKTGCRVNDFQLNEANGQTKLKLHFHADNMEKSQGDFDFLIGADGIRSSVRQVMTERKLIKSLILEYDYAALWLSSHSNIQSDELCQTVEGTQKLIGLLPIGESEVSFFWGLRASDYETLKQSDFEAWKLQVVRDCPDAESLLQDRKSFDDFTFGKYGHIIINKMFADRVILLGDAAHATSPHLGQGANLGLEDAYSFARCLELQGGFDSACQQFSKERASKIRYYQRLTRFLSPFFQSDGWVLGSIRNLCLPWFPHLPFVRTQMLRTLCGIKSGWLG